MRNKHITLIKVIILIIFISTHSVYAQGHWTTFSPTNTGTNGLISNGVTCMAKDTTGNIWFSTDKGVSMYNGEEWITHFPFDSVPGSFGIKSIAVDNSNNVWTSNMASLGLSKYNGDIWTLYNILPNNNIYEICPTDSLIWFATNNGLLNYNGSVFSHVHFGDTTLQIVWNPQTGQNDTIVYYNDYSVTALAVDHNNNLWVSGYDYVPGAVLATLKMFDGSDWTSYTTNDGVIDTLINSISVDTAGNVWFGSYDKGVSKFDYSTFTSYTKGDGLISDSIYSIGCDSSGNMWFGTPIGASKFDGENWISYNEDSGLILKYINNIIAGNNNDIWFGSGMGVSVYNGVEFVDYSTIDGLIDNWVQDIDCNKKGVWIDTHRGASFYDGNTWKGYDFRNGLSGIDILAAEEDNLGRIWFGILNAGATILDGENATVLQGNQFRSIKDILEDKSGNMWLGGIAGLSKFDGVDWSFISTNHVAPGGSINSLALDSSNNIWAGFTKGIVGKYDGSTWSSDTLYCGGANTYVNSIVVDSNGIIWSHSKGLFKFDGNNWIELDSTDGFMHSIVNGLAIDKNNKLWITTNDGVTCYEGINFTDYLAPNGFYLGQTDVDPFNNKWFRLDAYGVARYCESMSISGSVSYHGTSLSEGIVFLYSVKDTELELIEMATIDTYGNYNLPLEGSGYYVVSASADTSNYTSFVETYYNSTPNSCNHYEIIEMHCGDSLVTIDIAQYDTADILTANYSYYNNGNGNYSFANNSLGNFNISHWAFGDGNTSNEMNPDHTFESDGIYIVVLTIRDSTSTTSCFDFIYDTLEVTGVELPLQCSSGFVIFPDTTLSTITVVNSSTGDNLSYFWDFGDGNTSLLPYPYHTYSSPGPFNICLNIDDGNGCNDIYCDSIGENGIIFRQEGFNINVIPPTVTGTDNIVDTNLEIKIYPNPVSGSLIVESELIIERINIIGINGKKYNSVTSGFHKIDVKNLPSGIYILNCITSGKSVNNKFIKY